MTGGLPRPADLERHVKAWIAEDPDPRDRSELGSLLAESRGSESALSDLADRFADRLHFGTAGLRGPVGAGPNRMNRAVVRSTTAALTKWLDQHRPGASAAGVVVGCDARHRSSDMADEATAVLVGAGIKVHRLPDRKPTPLLAFAVPYLGAAAGVMVTASHNPPGDNGYKLYLEDGAQIVPPVDFEIERLIEGIGPLSEIPLGRLDGDLVSRPDGVVQRAYLATLSPWARRRGSGAPRLVYTPMHGVAGRIFQEALAGAGYPAPHVVSEQEDPDPNFPTVAFPNPEEPGALDLAFALARKVEADLVIANDPDGDRMAAAVPDEATPGGWRRLTGDEVGVLLGDFVISRTRGDDRLVAASIVSSSMLSRVAAAVGLRFVATLTGFKWIVRAPLALGGRLIFGYEEALGYSVGDAVHDKDGISAAMALLSLVDELRSEGVGLLERLDDLYEEHGVHLTSQVNVRTDDPGLIMGRLRSIPPRRIGRLRVAETVDLSGGVVWQEGLPPLPPSDALAFRLDSARVIVRPSGTEPKLKAYLESVRPVGTEGVKAAKSKAQRLLQELETSLQELIGKAP